MLCKNPDRSTVLELVLHLEKSVVFFKCSQFSSQINLIEMTLEQQQDGKTLAKDFPADFKKLICFALAL